MIYIIHHVTFTPCKLLYLYAISSTITWVITVSQSELHILPWVYTGLYLHEGFFFLGGGGLPMHKIADQTQAYVLDADYSVGQKTRPLCILSNI